MSVYVMLGSGVSRCGGGVGGVLCCVVECGRVKRQSHFLSRASPRLSMTIPECAGMRQTEWTVNA